jgi:hypothetical protein
VVLALTVTGTVKVWTLNGLEEKATSPILENESKQLRWDIPFSYIHIQMVLISNYICTVLQSYLWSIKYTTYITNIALFY